MQNHTICRTVPSAEAGSFAGQSGFENFDKLTEALNKAFGAVGEAPEKAPEEKSSQPGGSFPP